MPYDDDDDDDDASYLLVTGYVGSMTRATV